MKNLKELFVKIAEEQCGFLTEEDVLSIRSVIPNASMNVLVRCGRDRLVCSLGDLESTFAHVESRDDYVRDVSIPHRPHPKDWIVLGYIPPKIS